MKVLVISHNCICTHDAMGKTLLSLFANFKKEELCQLYFYPTIPDVDKCNSFYRITDKSVLKSYFRFYVKGEIIESCEVQKSSGTLFQDENDVGIYRNRKNKKPFRKILRDIMWKMSGWFNKSLRRWIENQKPTHIFVAPGTARFTYDIALKISQKYNLPIITYICDDYYFVKDADSLLGRIQQGQLKKKIKQLLGKTSRIVTICDELKELYSKEFGVVTQTVMTGSQYSLAKEPRQVDKINAITFMGNVRCNRYKSLVDIGKAIDEINQDKGTDFRLKIYTGEKDETILTAFDGINSVELCGFVSGEAFTKTFFESQALIHTEAFDEKCIDLVKNSVSTKIADSLSSGICLFAYGPDSVASMKHLIRNECAIVCTNKDELKEKLLTIFFDKEKREEVVEKALDCAKIHHDKNVVGQRIREIFERD